MGSAGTAYRAPTTVVLAIEFFEVDGWASGANGFRILRLARLIRHARYFTLQLAESYLTGALFWQILQRIERLGCHPT